MATLTRRQKQIGFAVVTVVAFITITGFVYDYILSGPTPEEARAALAAKGWCKTDAPIRESDGNLWIGKYRCGLWSRTWRTPELVYWENVRSYRKGVFRRGPTGEWVAVQTHAEGPQPGPRIE